MAKNHAALGSPSQDLNPRTRYGSKPDAPPKRFPGRNMAAPSGSPRGVPFFSKKKTEPLTGRTLSGDEGDTRHGKSSAMGSPASDLNPEEKFHIGISAPGKSVGKKSIDGDGSAHEESTDEPGNNQRRAKALTGQSEIDDALETANADSNLSSDTVDGDTYEADRAPLTNPIHSGEPRATHFQLPANVVTELKKMQPRRGRRG